MKSKLFGLDWGKDGKRALIMAIFTPIVVILLQALEAGTFAEIDWKLTIMIGIGAGITYIKKNLATNSDDKIFTKEPK